MNESFQAKEGLSPDLFPEDVPTYTGHYHKPHVVENTNIQYIGSPYQGNSLTSNTCTIKHLLVPVMYTTNAYPRGLNCSRECGSQNDCNHNLTPMPRRA